MAVLMTGRLGLLDMGYAMVVQGKILALLSKIPKR